ncbi:MAG: hydrolase [Nitrospirae bacterium]|nr:hydrolase [Nitrospirota bacterium]
MEKFYIDKNNAALVIVDIQEKLAVAMKAKEDVVKNNLHLIELAKLQNIPIVVTEQYSKGLGPTVSEIRTAVAAYQPIEKLTFSCCGETGFPSEMKKLGKKQVILTGMETHVCVLQTCIDLLKDGYIVHVVRDAICSRSKENWKTALEYMRDAGAVITCTETVLFQLLKVAGTEEFKAISKRIR